MSSHQESKPWNIPVLTAQIGTKVESLHSSSQTIDELVREAETARREILEQARWEAERLREEAQVQGYEQGYRSGTESSKNEAISLREQQLAEYQESLAELHSSYANQEQEYLEKISLHLNDLAGLACQRMVGVLNKNSLPTEEIHRAIMSLSHQSRLRVRVHPDSDDIWPSHLPIDLVKDDSLEPGDFHLEADSGSVDGSWKTRWARLLEIIQASPRMEKQENHD